MEMIITYTRDDDPAKDTRRANSTSWAKCKMLMATTARLTLLSIPMQQIHRTDYYCVINHMFQPAKYNSSRQSQTL
jgi:hypothetical protein